MDKGLILFGMVMGILVSFLIKPQLSGMFIEYHWAVLIVMVAFGGGLGMVLSEYSEPAPEQGCPGCQYDMDDVVGCAIGNHPTTCPHKKGVSIDTVA